MEEHSVMLSDGYDFEADSQAELLDQLTGYRDYELMRIREINAIIEDIQRTRIELTDNQMDAIVDAVTEESGWLVESAILDDNTLIITFDSDLN